jgi:predicted RND superfamily exporter protein
LTDISPDFPQATAGVRSIAFGLERLALIPFRVPVATVVVALGVAILAILGLQRIKTDDSLSQLFRSEDPSFKQFEEISRKFPSSEYDVLVVINGQTLLSRESIQKLQSLVTDVQLIDGTRGVLSMFSARKPAPEGGLPEPVFPDPLPEDESAYHALIDQAKANPIIHGKLLSDDGRLALAILSLEPSAVDGGKLESVVSDIRRTADEDLQGTGLTTELTGVPVMQLGIRHALERDRILYNAVGFALGCVVAGFFFRRLSLMLVAAGPPLLAIVFALGALGWLGFRLNMFLNVMTPLIMVISFSDSMQLTFAARDQLMAGADKRTAFRNAILIVGPACVLTHAAAGLSLLGLLTSSSDLIRGFGEAGFLATAVALVTTLSLVPTFGVLLIPDEARLVATLRAADPGVTTLRRFCSWIARHMVSHPALFSLVDIVVVVALAVFYSGLEPSYRLADEVPDKEQALTASGRLDAQISGSNPIQVLITFPPGLGLYTAQTLATVADVQTVLESQPGVGNVWSLESLRRWLVEQMGATGIDTLRQYVNELPVFLVRRFIATDESSVVVFGLVPDKNLTQLVPIVDQLDRRLNAVRKADPGYGVAVTGLAVVAARNSAGMINKLNRALTFEFAFIAAFIGIAFRSFRIGLACLPSGIFPIVAAGSLLRVLGYGLQFSGVVALFVSFGLGLSATIHFLNRMTQRSRSDEDPAIAVEQATVLMGPALILTALVLSCGLVALVFSDLPPLRLFGWLGAFAMLAALAADLLILRPVITFLLGLGRGAPALKEATAS